MPQLTRDSEAWLQPPQGTIEQIPSADGGTIRCLHAGHGEPIVLAHGYLLELTIWREVLDALVAAGRRVVAFDQRGHGASTPGTEGCTPSAAADDYRAVLQHFELRDATLVAHSMGAYLAVVFCLRRPELARRHLARLVLLGGNAGAVARGSLHNRLQTPLLKSGLLRPLWALRPSGRALIRQLFGGRPDPVKVEATRRILLRQAVSTSLPLLRGMMQDNHYPQLRAVPLPATVLCGERDGTCPRWHSERLGAEIPGSSNVWLPDVGHMLSYEAPDAVVRASLHPETGPAALTGVIEM